jgi:hypothetical protein
MRLLSENCTIAMHRALRSATQLMRSRYRYWVLLGLLVFSLIGWAVARRLAEETPDNAARLARAGAPPLMMAGQDHRVDPLPSSYQADDRLAATIRGVRDALTRQKAAISSTNFRRDDYLNLIDGVVKYFRPFQDKKGRIIDPYLHREYQYSTPTFALAAATLIVSGRDGELLGSASKALDSALYQLASGAVTDRHGDFFILPTMMAYRHLKDIVDPTTRKRWDRYLEIINPEIAYSDLIGKGQPDVINWNSGAIAGEFLRHKEGFTGGEFVNRYLDAQIIRFTPDGLYRDPKLPLVYDASARFNFLVLLNEGYDGKHQKDLAVLLERGAWVSLLMQSPAGDAPTGGRSTEHVWTDALQCASFELWARRMRVAGDESGAQAFKRSAHLAARLMSRWVRPSGEFWIVKNRFDPALRRGFESYSSHSQYNLLAAAYLSMAWSVADDSIAEGASPADIGGFVVDLSDFHKVFANSGGNYIEIDTAADPHYNSTGLLRVHKRGMEGQLGLSDNAPSSDSPLALGVGWRTAGEVHSLAEFPYGRVRASTNDIDVTPEAVRFSVAYRLDGAGVKQVRETYTLTRDTLSVSAWLDGPVESWRVTFPAFVSNGQSIGQVSVNGSTITIRSEHAKQIFEITSPAGSIVKKTGHIVAIRTGDYEVVEAVGGGNAVSYRLSAPVDDN